MVDELWWNNKRLYGRILLRSYVVARSNDQLLNTHTGTFSTILTMPTSVWSLAVKLGHPEITVHCNHQRMLEQLTVEHPDKQPASLSAIWVHGHPSWTSSSAEPTDDHSWLLTAMRFQVRTTQLNLDRPTNREQKQSIVPLKFWAGFLHSNTPFTSMHFVYANGGNSVFTSFPCMLPRGFEMCGWKSHGVSLSPVLILKWDSKHLHELLRII